MCSCTYVLLKLPLAVNWFAAGLDTDPQALSRFQTSLQNDLVAAVQVVDPTSTVTASVDSVQFLGGVAAGTAESMVATVRLGPNCPGILQEAMGAGAAEISSAKGRDTTTDQTSDVESQWRTWTRSQ